MSSREQTEYLGDEPRVLAFNAGGTTGLAQILAGKPGRDEIDVGQVLQASNVPD
jgi:hypothetical protein